MLKNLCGLPLNKILCFGTSHLSSYTCVGLKECTKIIRFDIFGKMINMGIRCGLKEARAIHPVPVWLRSY